MFNHIGRKIKTVAKVICWLGIILSVVTGIGLIALSPSTSTVTYSYNYSSFTTDSVLAGILTMVFGSLISWIASFFAYGFGELIDNSEIIKNNLTNQNAPY